MRYHLLFSAALLALFLLTTVSATHKRKELKLYQGECGLGYHKLDVVTHDGCTGEIPVLSCAGVCQSSAVPKFVENKYQEDEIEFDYVTECCTATRRVLGNVTVPVTCKDGSEKEILHFSSTVVECACATLF